ncbi:MAG TPA: hypothetical protein EYQ63_28495 [Fuerstia sp.]|nr:hypothetical protein [Fuerstiella sp.]
MSLQLLKKIGHHLGVDTAVGYAVAARGWQLLTGQLTMLLIVFCLTEVEQGYYYAFFYLLAMQIFVELGLHVVIISVASHEWSQLRMVDDKVAGDPCALSRLASLSRMAARWYLLAAGAFVVVIAIAGYVYFSWPTGQTPAGLNVSEWAAPWTSLVLLTGMQLVLLPMSSILEGCGQLPTINKVRFWQGVAGSAVVWSMMSTGFGLWALSGSAAVRLCGETYLVRRRFGQFFASLKDGDSGQAIDWKSEVVPLQWRIAIQGTLHWFATHLAGLVIFKCHGEAMGGRFGLMWTVLTALQSASMAWVETRRPLFGQLIAERKYEELDRLFFRLSRISLILIAVGGATFTAGVYVVNEFPNTIFTHIASRVPDVWSTAIFAMAFFAFQPALCTNIYVRAHKRDPFLIPAIVSSLTIAVLVFWLGRAYGIEGSGYGYLLGVGVVQTPLWVLVWYRCRKSWHAEETTT